MRFCLFRRFLATATVLALPTIHSAADDLTTRPNPDAGPTEVRMTTIFIDLDAINGADQSFTANVGFSASWKDERLRHDGPGAKRTKLENIWNPRIQILNQQRLQLTFPQEATVSPEGSVEVIQRAWGQFSQPFELHDFPLDSQRLNIILVAAGHEPGSVKLVINEDRPSSLAKAFSISDWNVLDSITSSEEVAITKGAKINPVFRFTLTVKRKYGYYLIKVVFPLIMIICMSWVVFWISPKNAGPRISVAVTGMLTLVAYRFAIGANLPKIAYLTRMDWFILGSSLLVFLSLVEVIVTGRLAETGSEKTADRINSVMRFAAPIFFLVICVLALALPIGK